MGFLKSLFSKKGEPKGEPFIPTPKQNIPGLEPIVVHAVENLYPSIEDQNYTFTFLLKHSDDKKALNALALLRLFRLDIRRIENIMKKSFCYDW